MMKCEEEIGAEMAETLQPPPPPEKKQKLMSPPPRATEYVSDSDSDSDSRFDCRKEGIGEYYKLSDTDSDEEEEIYRRLNEVLALIRTPNPLDLTHAKPIHFDLPFLKQHGVPDTLFRSFLQECRNRNTLVVYDYSGGRIPHQEGENIRDWDKEIANAAVDFYNEELCKEEGDSKLILEGVDKSSHRVNLLIHFYLTFRARDELTNQVFTYQAEVLDPYRGNPILGMLRDATNDKVLAIAVLDQESEGESGTSTPGSETTKESDTSTTGSETVSTVSEETATAVNAWDEA